MSKILHSTTESYTDYIGGDEGKLGRGLLDDKRNEAFKSPEELPEYLCSEPTLVLRQTIAVLDKVIGKGLSLTSITSDVYIHRVRLGEALWRKLDAVFERKGVDKNDLQALERKWLAKVHPYSRHNVDRQNPSADENCKFLLDREDREGKKGFRTFLKKWGPAIWPAVGEPVDYDQIAGKIIDHLSGQELTIKEGESRLDRKGRPKNPQPTGKGLMETRGLSASKSASDPRRPSKKRVNSWEDSPERQAEKKKQADNGEEEDTRPDAQIRYFRNGHPEGDVAKAIYDGVLSVLDSEERIFNAWFGAMTYEHFGKVLNEQSELEDPIARKKLWNLHNAIRGYYKTLVTSQRFRRTLRENAKARTEATYDKTHPTIVKLKTLLPDNEAQLMARLSAGQKNANMSEAIRLGKLLVHAAAKTEIHVAEGQGGESANEYFKEQMSLLATSAGQSEIKRIETFARTWRQSSALATRTLTGLTDMRFTDVNNNEQSRIAAAQPIDHIRNQIPLIFGSKDVFQEGLNRASLFLGADDITVRENVWALVRLGAGIRDAVQHFNVRPRLLRTVESGFLEPHDDTVAEEIPIENRFRANNKTVTQSSFQAMDQLLAFDKEMRKEAVRLQLKALKAHEFLDWEQLPLVVGELGGLADFNDIAPPRFTSVVNLVHALADNDDVELHADLRPLLSVQKVRSEALQTEDNLCRKGLLQMVYGSGFQAWFAEKANDAALYLDVVGTVIAQKNDRVDQYERKTRGKKIPTASEMAEWLDWESKETLGELLRSLAQRSVKETDQDIRYRADTIVQSAAANRIERFRQEVYAHLFARYLKEQRLLFITEIKEAQATDISEMDNAMTSFQDTSLAHVEPWHARFYTWLYLVPPPEISMLRHQMKKSVALEEKSPSETDERAIELLEQMDRLMALYTQVQAAGFSGVEHRERLKQATFLYEDEDDFSKVFSDESEDSDQTFAGTRRGLRQIIRYGDIQTLEPIFKSHHVSKAEVATFTGVDDVSVKKLFDDFTKLRTKIVDDATGEKPKSKRDLNALIKRQKTNVAQYERDLLRVAHHNFHTSAARLTDHVKLHHVLMAVVARLTDYSLMWERDKTFAYFGLLYRDIGNEGFEPSYGVAPGEREGKKTFGFKVKGRITDQRAQEDPNDNSRPALPDFIQLIDPERGFSNHFDELAIYLSPEDAAMFRLAFVEVEAQNPQDVRAEKEAETRNETARPFVTGHFRKRAHIRNQLAHLEVIRNSNGLNLTYLMNAVRSLMAYDQKQKNAVVKSVKRILNDFGLQAEWRIKEDRLARPEVYPLAERHLTMVRGPEFDDLRIFMPRATVRLTSMVQALFDFGSGGHGVKHPKNAPETVVLNYPAAYYRKTGTTQYEPADIDQDGRAGAGPNSLREAAKLKFAYTK